ncbi:MAG: nuclear transport factor 2 family protein [Candidatus Aminicenantaceae bacterium]
MIKGFTLILVAVFLVACGQGTSIGQKGSNLEKGTELAQKAPDLKKEKKKLLETDRLFSQASKEKGFAGAFALFLSEEARVFQNNFPPIVGRDAIMKFMAENATGTITWEPYFVEMSASADLGYTLGKYQSTVSSDSGKKTVSYGHYVTIWKKQPDGSWKVVFDSGIQTPE